MGSGAGQEPGERPTKTVHVSAGVIVVDAQGRVLLQLRDDDPNIPFPNHWGITGGEADDQEEPEDAAKREVHEETGLMLDAVQPFKVFEKRLEDGTPAATHYFYARTTTSADDMVVGEGQALRFFHPAELDALPIAYSHRWVLAEFVASAGYRACFSDEDDR